MHICLEEYLLPGLGIQQAPDLGNPLKCHRRNEPASLSRSADKALSALIKLVVSSVFSRSASCPCAADKAQARLETNKRRVPGNDRSLPVRDALNSGYPHREWELMGLSRARHACEEEL